jgi:uncharacterized protein HemX
MPQAVAIPLGFALGAATVGGSIVQTQQAKQSQRRALRSQEQAQKEAADRAAAATKRALGERRRRDPDVGSLLTGEQRGAGAGVGSTLLTGAGGVKPGRQRLAGSTLLGG